MKKSLPNVPSPHVIKIPLSLAKTENPSPAAIREIDFAYMVKESLDL